MTEATAPPRRNALAAAMAGSGSLTVPFPTLDEVKAALGIEPTDTSKDAAITAGLAATVAMIETYLGRGIAYGPQRQQFEPVETRNPKLMLWRFPIDTVESVTQDGGAVSGWRALHSQGVLEWGQGCGCYAPRYRCERDPLVVVNYTGGYPDDAWPADLLEAVMRAFYGRWNATGGNIASTTNGAPIRSWSADGLTVQYADADVLLSDSTAASTVPPDLMGVAAMLEPYRARYVSGV